MEIKKNKKTKTYFVPIENLNFTENYSLERLRKDLSNKQNGKDYSFPIRQIFQPSGESRIEVLPYIDNIAGWSEHLDEVVDHQPGRELFPDL